MRYVVELKCVVRGITKQITWVNGGVGYTEEELVRVKRKIENDPRIVEYKIVER